MAIDRHLDGAAAMSAHIAPAKAHTSALSRRESKVYEDIINNGRTAFLSAPTLQGMLEGGVPVILPIADIVKRAAAHAPAS